MNPELRRRPPPTSLISPCGAGVQALVFGSSKKVGALAKSVTEAREAMAARAELQDFYSTASQSLRRRTEGISGADTRDADVALQLWVEYTELKATAGTDPLAAALFDETATFIGDLAKTYYPLAPMQPSSDAVAFENASLQRQDLDHLACLRSLHGELVGLVFDTIPLPCGPSGGQGTADTIGCEHAVDSILRIDRNARAEISSRRPGLPPANLHGILLAQLDRQIASTDQMLHDTLASACKENQLHVAVAADSLLVRLGSDTNVTRRRSKLFTAFAAAVLEPVRDDGEREDGLATGSIAPVDIKRFADLFQTHAPFDLLQAKVKRLQKSMSGVAGESTRVDDCLFGAIEMLAADVAGVIADPLFPPTFRLAATDTCSAAIDRLVTNRLQLDMDQIALAARTVHTFSAVQPQNAVQWLRILVGAVRDMAISPDTMMHCDQVTAIYRAVVSMQGSEWTALGCCSAVLKGVAQQLVAVVRVHSGECNREGVTWSISESGTLVLRLDVTPQEGRHGAVVRVHHPHADVGELDVQCPALKFGGPDKVPTESVVLSQRGFFSVAFEADRTDTASSHDRCCQGALLVVISVVGMPEMMAPRSTPACLRRFTATIQKDSTINIAEDNPLASRRASGPRSSPPTPVVCSSRYVEAYEIAAAICNLTPRTEVLAKGSLLNPTQPNTYTKLLVRAGEFSHPDKGGTVSKSHYVISILRDLFCGVDTELTQEDYLDASGAQPLTKGTLRAAYDELAARVNKPDSPSEASTMPTLKGGPDDPVRVDVVQALRTFVSEARIKPSDAGLNGLMRQGPARELVCLDGMPMTAADSRMVIFSGLLRGTEVSLGRSKCVLKSRATASRTWWQDDVEVTFKYPSAVAVYANRQEASAISARPFYNLEIKHRLTQVEVAAGMAFVLLEIPDADEVVQLTIKTVDHRPIPAGGHAMCLTECGALQWNSFRKEHHRGQLTVQLC